MTPLQREQLRGAIFLLLMRRILAAVADQEVAGGGPLQITEFLYTQMPMLSKPLVDEIQDAKRVAHLLPWIHSASVDTQTVTAEIADVSGEVVAQIEVILQERDYWHPV